MRPHCVTCPAELFFGEVSSLRGNHRTMILKFMASSLPSSILPPDDEKPLTWLKCEGTIRGEAITILGFHEERGSKSDIGHTFDQFQDQRNRRLSERL